MDTVALGLDRGRLSFTFDDGERFDVNVHELLAEIDYELVAETLADADLDALRRAA